MSGSDLMQLGVQLLGLILGALGAFMASTAVGIIFVASVVGLAATIVFLVWRQRKIDQPRSREDLRHRKASFGQETRRNLAFQLAFFPLLIAAMVYVNGLSSATMLMFGGLVMVFAVSVPAQLKLIRESKTKEESSAS